MDRSCATRIPGTIDVRNIEKKEYEKRIGSEQPPNSPISISISTSVLQRAGISIFLQAHEDALIRFLSANTDEAGTWPSSRLALDVLPYEHTVPTTTGLFYASQAPRPRPPMAQGPPVSIITAPASLTLMKCKPSLEPRTSANASRNVWTCPIGSDTHLAYRATGGDSLPHDFCTRVVRKLGSYE